MNLQEANFHDLLDVYYFGTSAKRAEGHLISLLHGEQDAALKTLLRDYRTMAVRKREEIALRAGVDRLMNCYSIMEIASLGGLIADSRSSEFGRNALTILEHKHVRRYYEEFYPTRLPELFRWRIAGCVASRCDAQGSSSHLHIMAFLELDRRFMRSLEDDVFLRMLDSFWIGGYGFRDVVETIGRPRDFMEHLLRDPEEWDVISKALNQFSIFMQFCLDLDRLLGRSRKHPLLQSAMWNHYSYWFEIIGESLSERLGEALERFVDWKPTTSNKDAAAEIQSYVGAAKEVLMRLTSRAYLKPIEQVLMECRAAG